MRSPKDCSLKRPRTDRSLRSDPGVLRKSFRRQDSQTQTVTNKNSGSQSDPL